MREETMGGRHRCRRQVDRKVRRAFIPGMYFSTPENRTACFDPAARMKPAGSGIMPGQGNVI
jgi:hypothetical protein